MSAGKQLAVSAAVIVAAVVTVFASGTSHWPVAAAASVVGLPAVGGFLAAWGRVFPSAPPGLAPWRSARTLSRRFIEDCWVGWGVCHPDATEALCRAWQVTIADPEWGRPDLLWRVLPAAVTAPQGVARWAR